MYKFLTKHETNMKPNVAWLLLSVSPPFGWHTIPGMVVIVWLGIADWHTIPGMVVIVWLGNTDWHTIPGRAVLSCGLATLIVIPYLAGLCCIVWLGNTDWHTIPGRAVLS
jgi:hypothetical protein